MSPLLRTHSLLHTAKHHILKERSYPNFLERPRSIGIGPFRPPTLEPQSAGRPLPHSWALGRGSAQSL